MQLRVALVLVGLAACGGDKAPTTERREAPTRRVIEPPHGDVRALPPHAITADGVGPFKLGLAMTESAASLPPGTRMSILQIPGVVDHSVLRDAGLIIGGERSGATSYIAVIRVAIARTGDGIGVGTDRAALERALGPAVGDPQTVRDPGLWVGAGLPGARFVLYADRVGALVLSAPPTRGPAPDDGCVRPDLVDEVGLPATARGACLDGAQAIAAAGEQVVALATADGKVKRVATADVPGLRWAAPIRGPAGVDEVVAVAEQVTADGRTAVVQVMALEGGRLVRLGEVDAFRLSETSAGWIGARLADLEVRLEITRVGDELTIGGLLIHGGTTAVIDAAPLSPVSLRLSRRPPDRGRLDAGVASEADAGLPTDAPTR